MDKIVHKKLTKIITLLAQSPSYKAACRSAIEGLFGPLRNKTSSLFFSQIQHFVPVLSHAIPIHKE